MASPKPKFTVSLIPIYSFSLTSLGRTGFGEKCLKLAEVCPNEKVSLSYN